MREREETVIFEEDSAQRRSWVRETRQKYDHLYTKVLSLLINKLLILCTLVVVFGNCTRIGFLAQLKKDRVESNRVLLLFLLRTLLTVKSSSDGVPTIEAAGFRYYTCTFRILVFEVGKSEVVSLRS
jgi:hypothetical protein